MGIKVVNDGCITKDNSFVTSVLVVCMRSERGWTTMRPVNFREVENMRSVIGQKVIVISNSEPYVSVGIIESFQPITQSDNLVPLVHFENNSEARLCLGAVLPYDYNFHAFLANKNALAFDWLSKLVQMRETMSRLSMRKDGD